MVPNGYALCKNNMKMNMRLASAIFLCTLIVAGCAKKKTNIDPTVPEIQQPVVSETPPQSPPPSQPLPPGKTLEAPPLKPRAPSRGDTAALKIVESGVKQLNAGNVDDAEQYFEQALRVSPTNGKPYYYLGVIAAQKKDYDRALGFLSQAEVLLREDGFWMSQALTREATVLKALNRKEEARAKLQEALRRDPANKWADAELQKLQ